VPGLKYILGAVLVVVGFFAVNMAALSDVPTAVDQDIENNQIIAEREFNRRTSDISIQSLGR
jgi:hypothetical protein